LSGLSAIGGSDKVTADDCIRERFRAPAAIAGALKVAKNSRRFGGSGLQVDPKSYLGSTDHTPAKQGPSKDDAPKSVQLEHKTVDVQAQLHSVRLHAIGGVRVRQEGRCVPSSGWIALKELEVVQTALLPANHIFSSDEHLLQVSQNRLDFSSRGGWPIQRTDLPTAFNAELGREMRPSSGRLANHPN